MVAGACVRRVVDAAHVDCAQIDLVVDEREPVGVVLVRFDVRTVAGLAVVEVVRVAEEGGLGVVGLEVADDVVVGEVEVSASGLEGDPGWLAEELEVDIEGESVAGHDEVVGEETSAGRDLAHVAVGVA